MPRIGNRATNILFLGGTHGQEPQSSIFVIELYKQLKHLLYDKQTIKDDINLIQIDISKILELNNAYAQFKVDTLSISNLFDEYLDETNQYIPYCPLTINTIDTLVYKNINLIFLPVLNPSGIAKKTRGNLNKVDLNRNLPTINWTFQKTIIAKEDNPYYGGKKPLSELENQFLLRLIEKYAFDLVISFHTNHFVRNKNPEGFDYDAGSKFYKEWVYSLAKSINLNVTEGIGYPTPGSLGSFAKENKFDVLTVEFEDTMSAKEIQSIYLDQFTHNIMKLLKR